MTSHKKRKRKEIKLADRLAEKEPRVMQRANVYDLCQKRPALPTRKEAIIFASGINGVDVYDDVNPDDFSIAVNDAITIPEIHNKPNIIMDVWFIQDVRTCLRPYFKEADKKFKGIRVFSISAASSSESFLKPIEGKHFTFDYCTPEQSALPWSPPKWRYRTDTTVAGSALWFCHKQRIEKVRLCGVDFNGGKYHSGEMHPQKRHAGTWRVQRDSIEEMIEWLMRQGLIVETMSRTSIRNVPKAIRVDVPETVYIVGPGEKGVEALDKIPADAHVWLLNMMGAIWKDFNVKWKPAALVVADKDAVLKDWWDRALTEFKGLRLFSNEVVARACCDADVLYPIDSADGWIYRSKGTVAGVALHLLHLSGKAKKIILVGVDMSGNKYADKSENPDPRWLREHGKIWKARPVLDATIKYLRERGIEIYSLSETKLREVEMR